jgi:eukaryotic-like serine/threonine-protein kinase
LALRAGSRVGPYEILSPLGAGGMGEVYRARDPRLDRFVAVKVLPPHLSASPEVRQRFEREARTISQLSHPHICAIYDVGRDGDIDYLVMELLEGETLSERLAKGALPLEQTLRYGVEIADALGKAHRQGIVHRDLKPGNVMVTKSGVKLLDFGLAKVIAPTAATDLTALPTQASPVTQAGTILGTFQYMAPEQLEGKEADARTDIFTLGAVLYEMATGRKAFSGTSQASLITAIMSWEPAPISSIQPMSPPALDRVVKTCMAKDPEERWQSAADVKREFGWIAEGSVAGVAAPVALSSRRRTRELLAWALAAVGVLGGAAALLSRRSAPPPDPIRFTFAFAADLKLRHQDCPALSPDGRRLALMMVNPGRQQQLWVQPLDSLEPRRLEGTEGARFPFWSPDGRAIAFFQGGRLRRIDADGGTIQTICDGAGSGFGGTWGAGGTIVFGATFGGPLWRIPASGGTKTAATVLDRTRGDSAHLFPTFLPDGRHFVFAARNVDPVKSTLALADLESKETRVLWRSDSGAVWAPSGYLLFAREGTLFAQGFDPRRRASVGEPFSVAGDVRFYTDNSLVQATAGGDLLAYGLWRHDRRLVWVDRKGRELGTIGQIGDYEDVRISPSGDRVAAAIRDPAAGWNNDVWVLDVGRGIASRVSSERSDEFAPVWSPDGQRVFYTSDHAGFYDLYSRSSDGGSEELVLRTSWDKVVNEVTPDGGSLIFGGSPTGDKEDVWLLPLTGNRAPKAVIESDSFVEKSSRLSPDGKWVAFSSDESGRENVFVAPLPSGPKRPISDSGGVAPVWSHDGRELYYVAGDGKLTAVAVSLAPSGIALGPPQPLFDLDPAGLNSFDPRPYDVAPDGRFLVVRAVGQEPSNPVVVDVHWTARPKP